MDIEARKNELTEEEKRVLVDGGTEAPFSGALLDEHRKGAFRCKICNQELFSSETKFDSGTGWPLFDKAIEGSIRYVEDISHGMSRVEARCSKCDAHLGHVFPDGPTGTGKRYCMNSVCLAFEEGKE